MFNLGLKRVLIWADRPTRFRKTWFGFLAFLIILLLRVMFLSERPFLYDIMGGSFKIWFSNGCCCTGYNFLFKISLRFGTIGWYCVILFCFVGGGLVSFLEISLLRVCC